MKKAQLLMLCFLFSGSVAYSQSKFEVDAGAGLFEGLSIKVKYGNNLQIGLCQGFAQGSYWMTGVEGYYHFGGLSKYNNQKTFYAMSGISSTLFAKGYSNFEKIIIYPRIGKSFYFSKGIGVNADIGLGLLMADDINGYVLSIFPSFAVHFFIRF
jgi:hypothetical protein